MNQKLIPIQITIQKNILIIYSKIKWTSPNVNKTHFNLNPKGKRKELIIYKNVNVPQDILKVKKIINNNNFKLNKFKNFNFDYNPNNNVSVILNKNNKRPLEDNSTVIYSKNLSVERPNKFRNINFNKFVASINSVIPFSFSDAIQHEDHIEWEKAIMDELNNLYDNIFTFVKFVPPNKTIISTKWVFSTKKDINNKIIKRKARLVACGFNQRRGIDYELIYSPTLNIDCLKLIFALAAKFHWFIQQLNIKAAYLNADLDREIYATIPPEDTNFGKGFWKLNKALYGLKQSGR